MKLKSPQFGFAVAGACVSMMLMLSIWEFFSGDIVEFIRVYWQPLHPWNIVINSGRSPGLWGYITDLGINCIYAGLDGFIFGALIAVFYNLFAERNIQK